MQRAIEGVYDSTSYAEMPLAVSNDKLISGCSGLSEASKDLKLFDLETWECERTLQAGNVVRSLAVGGSKLLAGLTSGQIVAWDTQTWESEPALEGHEDSVEDLIVVGGTLVSASYDQIIKFWK